VRPLALLLLLQQAAFSYPLDGFERTGIRRLRGYALAHQGKIRASVKLPPGALRTLADVKLHLRGANDNYDITAATPRDAKLQAGLEKIFAGRNTTYHVALLDITDPKAPRYASLRADEKYIPGSVGKLFVATGVFGELARIYPKDTAMRERILRETVVTADKFVHRDGKTVPFYNDGAPAILNRRLEIGDKFNLYEWLDHMLSQSSNAAGSMAWEQAMLLRRYGAQYPPLEADRLSFFQTTPKTELRDIALAPIEDALKLSGLDTGKLRIGTMFTGNASNAVPGTASYASPNELLRWLVKLEQGKLVDPWSSLEMKRLIYFARPRYRYSSSPALKDAAVYFKSGSLFECEPEPGFKYMQYRGNKTNLMHSVAIVETGTKTYLVAMMSNVLRLNSAVEHQTIATFIDRLIAAD